MTRKIPTHAKSLKKVSFGQSFPVLAIIALATSYSVTFWQLLPLDATFYFSGATWLNFEQRLPSKKPYSTVV